MRNVLTAGLACVISVSAIGVAQAAAPVPAPAAVPAPVVKSTTDPDYAKKLELAKQMQEIQPVRKQVDDVVQQASASLAPAARDRFLKMTQSAFDYDKLAKASIDAMTEIFTVAELQKMVDYYGSAEAKTTVPKIPLYQQKLQPMIFQMLDKAMIEQRTGSESPPPNMPPVSKVSDVPITPAIPPSAATQVPAASGATPVPKIDPNPAATTRP